MRKDKWQEILEGRNGDGGVSELPLDESATDLAPSPDPNEYHPWILQRGRGRPALFIDLRRFEPKTGMLIGCQMSYPHLLAVDYIGDRMVSLDFGIRQYVIEGTGLAELPILLQQGMVLAIQEYSESIWSETKQLALVKRIVQVQKDTGEDLSS